MKQLVAVSALLCACAAASVAQADVLIPGAFSGIVDDGSYTDSGPQNTGFEAGQSINGSFLWDATTAAFQTFSIGGYTAAPGFTTVYSPALSATPYAFIGVENPIANAAPSDLLQINFYYQTTAGASTADITSFIRNPGAYSQDLTGGSPSYFAAYLTNTDGSVTQVDGLLTFYEAPEPASLLLTLPALLGLGAVRRRRG
nr:hypothetical protein [uncultured Rhodopila sp.]